MSEINAGERVLNDSTWGGDLVTDVVILITPNTITADLLDEVGGPGRTS